MRSETHHAPLILLFAAYGAGLATGLSRFGAPWVVGPVLVIGGAMLGGRPWIRAWCWTAAIGVAAGAFAWHGEARSCATLLHRGTIRLTIIPRDPPSATGGRVRAEVRGCVGEISVRGGEAEVDVPTEVTGTWIPRSEGLFDRPGGTLVMKEQVSHSAPRTSHALSARARLFDLTTRLYGARAPLVDALLFDRHGAIDPDTRDRFAASGLIHLLSISGFHVGLIVAWILALLRAARVQRERAWIVATLLGVLYVAWLGWPPPATRAAALAVLACLARLRQRVVRWDSLLAATAFAILLADPWSLADLGAWLSVGSLWGATHVGRWSDRRFGTGILARTLSGSLGATLATAPLTAAAVGTVSLAGLLLNFIGIPVAALALPAVIVSLVVAPITAPGAAALAAGGGALLAALDRIAALGAALPYGHFVTAPGALSALPWAALLAAACWCISQHATTTTALLRTLVVMTVVAWVALGSSVSVHLAPGAPGLTLTFLDVGQGDAAVLETPHQHWIAIDAGPEGEGNDAGRTVVAPFLVRHGVRTLDALILSHAHRDHYGGIPAVLELVRVSRFLEPGEAVDDPGYRTLLDRVAESGAAWQRIGRGDTLRVDGVEIIVLHPDTAWGEWGLDLNEDSDVLLVRYGGFRALFAGDAGFPAEADMAGQVGDVDLLKVGHHGSAGSTGAAWLAELHPELAVVSVGAHNRYHHPSADALGRLGAVGAQVWRTDEVGNVEVWTDGVTIRAGARGRERVLPAGPPSP